MLHFENLFKVVQYPSGETHVQHRAVYSSLSPWIIASNVRSFTDLCHVVSADQILRRRAASPKWFIPFFPFARDDRRNTPDDGFELGMALRMVENMDVTVLDPHSDVLGQLPHIQQQELMDLYWRELAPKDGGPIWVVPDAGALKKIKTGNHVLCGKNRNPLTGALTGFHIYSGAGLVAGNDVVIVDDICDAGGTFLGLAEELRKLEPKSISLAVTHGLFTRGVDTLFKAFDFIMTTGEVDHPRVHTISHDRIWSDCNAV